MSFSYHLVNYTQIVFEGSLLHLLKLCRGERLAAALRISPGDVVVLYERCKFSDYGVHRITCIGITLYFNVKTYPIDNLIVSARRQGKNHRPSCIDDTI
jgi:hypothetical protein